MKIGNYKTIKIQDLKAYDKNSRTHPTEQIEQIKKSIIEFGFTNPLLVNERNEIIAGHGRLEAVKQLNKVDFKDNPILEVPCIELTGLNEAQYKALVIADNKIAENAGWNFEILKEEIQSLELMNFDIDLLGFKEEELLEIGLENQEDIEQVEYEREAVYKEREEAKLIKQGDLIELGRHRILCGDSTKKEDIDKLMQGRLADLLITDPPYNVNYQGGTKEKLKIVNDKMSSEEFFIFLDCVFKNAYRVLKNGGVFYIWYAGKETLNFIKSLDKNNLFFRQILIWKKNQLVMGRHDYHFMHEPCLYGWKDGESHYWGSDRKQTTILEFDKPKRNDIHPTMKPVELFKYQICNSSRNGEIVLDLFLGSGTTLIACEELERICYGIEYDNRYVEAIIERYINFTGNNKIKINGQEVEWELNNN